MIQLALPNTLLLAGLALIVTVVLGVPLGLLAARYRGSWLDRVIRIVGVGGHAVPEFWFGLMFILSATSLLVRPIEIPLSASSSRSVR